MSYLGQPQNKKHDAIIYTIQEKRTQALRQAYSQLDKNNNLQNELEKFKFLLDEGAISEEEFKIAESKISHFLGMKKTSDDET